MLESFIIWYALGILGASLARGAFASGDRAHGREPDPITVGTLVVGSLFSLSGPVAIVSAIVWWVCAFFEHRPADRWKWMQPVRRVLNYKIFK